MEEIGLVTPTRGLMDMDSFLNSSSCYWFTASIFWCDTGAS